MKKNHYVTKGLYNGKEEGLSIGLTTLSTKGAKWPTREPGERSTLWEAVLRKWTGKRSLGETIDGAQKRPEEKRRESGWNCADLANCMEDKANAAVMASWRGGIKHAPQEQQELERTMKRGLGREDRVLDERDDKFQDENLLMDWRWPCP